MRALVVMVSMCAAGCGRLDFDARDDAAGMRDARPADATALLGCPSFALLCDDFETGDLSRWSDTSTLNGGSVAITTSPVHAGLFAMQATQPVAMTSGHEADTIAQLATQSTGMLAIREWFLLSQPLLNFDSLIIVENATGQHYVLVGGDGSAQWVVSEEHAGMVDDHHANVPVVQNAWQCVELDYTFVGTAPAEITLYVGDSVVLDEAALDAAPVYSEVRTGVANASVAGFGVIIDDVVIANQHIGCG